MAVSEAAPSGRSLPPLPGSPSKSNSDLKPNPHPYAIRTTNTALLTRSNSTGYNTNATRHYYVPLSPGPRSVNARTHRQSKSQPTNPENKAPRPLPIPPPFPSAIPVNGYTSADESFLPPRRVKRADTLPTSPAPYAPFMPSVTLDDLPANPKLWSPSQLSAYLITALRVTSASKSGDIAEIALPARVASDIATVVRDIRMTGRMFLRLNEEDLDAMNVNKKWQEALLLASRNLRQNVLKGRIWGADSDNPASPGSTSPTMPAHPFSSALYNSSSSSVNLTDKEDDEARHPKRYRNGRVRGMVESLERSGSFSSEGSFDESSGRPNVNRWVQDEGPVQDDVVWSPVATTHSPVYETSDAHRPALTEEPSIEDLLASAAENEKGQAWGARAWEEFDLAPGVTVKRARDSSDNSSNFTYEHGAEVFQTLGKINGKGSSKGKGREERRVVTAIFQPSIADAAPELVSANGFNGAGPKVEHGAQTDGNALVAESLARIEQALSAQVAENRALLEQFRTRLEVVENDVTALEEQAAQWKSDKCVPMPSAEEHHMPGQDTELRSTLCPTGASSSDVRHSDDGYAPPSLFSKVANFGTSVIAASTVAESSTKEGHGSGFNEVNDDEPASISELSSYVFLVGLGVCAVVLRVVFRKVGGRASLGWKS